MTTLLYSGNLGIGQDLHTVLRAAVCLNGDTDLTVLIVGDGKGLADMRQLVGELRLGNVEFRPPVPLYGLAALLAAGDIHLICQKPGTEGLLVPSKIYSTLAAGRPSLFVGPVDCEVGRILCDSRSGFIVEPGNVEGAVHALSALACSAALRREMGDNAREYYKYYFGRKRSVARIIDVIERVAGNRRKTQVVGQLDNLTVRPSNSQTVQRIMKAQ
jgi:glycosyltransferase involved in cell wall biosynthesis